MPSNAHVRRFCLVLAVVAVSLNLGGCAGVLYFMSGEATTGLFDAMYQEWERREANPTYATGPVLLKAEGADFVSPNAYGIDLFTGIYMAMISGTTTYPLRPDMPQQYQGITRRLAGPGTAMFAGEGLTSFSPEQGAYFQYEPRINLTNIYGVFPFHYESTNKPYLFWGNWAPRISEPVAGGGGRELGWDTFSYILGSLPPAGNLPRNVTMYYDTLFYPHEVGLVSERKINHPLDRAALAVQWRDGNVKIGIEASTRGGMAFASRGGLAAPEQSQIQFYGGGLFNGINLETSGCPFECQTSVDGFFTGPNAERAGMSYQIDKVTDDPRIIGLGVIPLTVRSAMTHPGTPVSSTFTAPLLTNENATGLRLSHEGNMRTQHSNGEVAWRAPRTELVSQWAQDTTTGGMQSPPGDKTFVPGTAQVVDIGGDEMIAWGGWTNGTYHYYGSTLNFGVNQVMPYVIGNPTPAAAIPASGTADFNLIGATRPAWSDGALGTGTFSGTMRALWGGISSTNLAANFRVTMPGDTTYDFVSSGGLANPGLSEIRTYTNFYGRQMIAGSIGLPLNHGGRACSAGQSCGMELEGFFAGPAAERLGLTYVIGSFFDLSSPNAYNDQPAMMIGGGAVFANAGSPAGGSSGGGSSGGGSGSITPLDTSGSLRMVQVGPNGFTPLTRNSLASATQDAAGVVTSYSPGAPDIYRIGTAQGVDAGGDALITWGRWVSGTTVLDGSGGGPITGNTIGADQGFHYVIGQPTAALPASGTANFTLLGATKPTFADGAFPAGTLTSTGPVAMAVAWGGNAGTQLAMALTVTMPGDGVYSIGTIGGLADPRFSGLSTSGSASFSGTADVTRTGTARACGGSACSATINGFFAGPNAERAGLVYQIAPAGMPPGSGTNINGAAVFVKQ